MTQKGKKQVKYKEFKIIEANPEVLTMDNPYFVNGLKILAHWIASAYLKDQREKYQKELETKSSKSIETPNLTQNSSSSKIRTSKSTAEDLPPDRLGFTVKEVSKLLGVGITTVNKAIETNQIRSVNFGGKVVIPKIALLEFLHNTSNKQD
ncbi:MAG: hypothetical protein A9183_07145 [Dehalococcoides mccartyi]|uniref:helix-turn-helix domain-containing protein n=1 Tax=Dehalococcoides mccartyi TaxID=61435 RepID=UPI0008049174|nr:helix-turn-helix domain-containing protein [Dehalococcoides mccartyi]OBW63490.1 MAG: hypothetical protein A9183_07145 [Dehalococcoides mccartyi]